MSRRVASSSLVILLLASPFAWAQEAEDDTPEPPPEASPSEESGQETEERGEEEAVSNEAAPEKTEASRSDDDVVLVVIGKEPRALQEIPGAAHVVTEEDLRNMAPLSANEALRVVPGVHIQEEEGIGLRPNIGIRGLNPGRSRNVLILEDGVPIALAPYGEPEMYYAPAIEGMERLEIIKGSGSILFGPQTIGGVVNYVTMEPPDKLTVDAEARGGMFGYGMGRVAVGNTVGRLGYHVSAMHQRFEGHRGLNLQVTDVRGRFQLRFSDRSALALKIGVYDELSNATYLGLTTPQFENDPSANHAIHDVLPVRRYSLSATHEMNFTPRLRLQTTVFGNQTSRNWTRQDYDRTPNPDRDYDRILDGNNRNVVGQGGYAEDGSSVFFRGTTGSRNRSFTIVGVEPRLRWRYDISPKVRGELQAGTRFLGEFTSEQRLDGGTPSTTSGALRTDERRDGLALAAYVHNRFVFADRFRVSAGLRIESLWHGRDILRDRVDGTPTDLDPVLSSRDHVFAPIPGLGMSVDATQDLTFFAGVHRGFAPPRTKDAVTASGETLELEAEYSWNVELGSRLQMGRGVYSEVTGFLLDFQNQVIPPTEAGGILTGDATAEERSLINGGRTRHTGVEAGVTVDVPALLEKHFSLPLTVNYTYVHAVFGDNWAEGIAGNRLPYAPEHMLSGQARFVHDVGLSMQANVNWISSQFHDKANTLEPSLDGTNGLIEGRVLVDARLGFNLQPYIGKELEVYVLGKNLTDERFIAARAPQGIQPGMFRQILGGVRGRF